MASINDLQNSLRAIDLDRRRSGLDKARTALAFVILAAGFAGTLAAPFVLIYEILWVLGFQ